MENEILVNDDVIESVEEVVETSGNGLKMAAGVGITAAVGVAAYKWLVKPIIAKIKARKDKNAIILPPKEISNEEEVEEETEE